MKLAGSYRLNTTEFPAPMTNWQEQPIQEGNGLDGFPLTNSYRIHTWNWPNLPGEYFELLAEFYATQQTNRTRLSYLETDPYEGDQGDDDYGTKTYTNFYVLPLNRQRGLPTYDDVTISFLVYTS